MNERNTILELKNVCKSFSTVQVLNEVSFSLKEKSILGLVGENGAGKSTLMNILGGVHMPSSGEINLFGKDYKPQRPLDAQKAGIAFIHQELTLFTNLSIAENIFIDNIKGVVSFSKLNSEAKKILTKLKVDYNPRTLVSELPMGARQMVEIAKAIAKKAKIIILDEPTTSLSDSEKEVFFNIMHELQEDGVSMIFISHMLDDIIKMCDEVVVLRDGFVIGERLDKEGLTKDIIIKKMIGREMSTLYPYAEKSFGEELFAVRNLTKEGVIDDISFSIKGGQIVGMFGLMGAGRSEFANIVFGIDNADSGEIILHGKSKKNMLPSKWIKDGVAYITENRRDDGLLLPKSVRDNLILVNMDNMKSKLGVLDNKQADESCDQMKDKLDIRSYSITKQPVVQLSGGNQQKAVIGKWLMREPKVFILDEPTRGVDVGAKYEIYTHINALAKEGSAVLFISSEMEELMGVCDSIIVMNKGGISEPIPREEFSQKRLMEFAVGI